MTIKLGSSIQSKLILIGLVSALIFTVASEWGRYQDHGPERDLVFLLETEKAKLGAAQVLNVPPGESLISIGGAQRAEVVQTIDDPDKLERLGILLKRVQMGRKPLNHPTTIAHLTMRCQSDGGEYYLHLQYLRAKDALTIEFKAGGAGDANSNNTNEYHLDGEDAIEMSKLVPPHNLSGEQTT